MRLQKKFCLRRMHEFWKKMKRRKCKILLAIVVSVLFGWFMLWDREETARSTYCLPIDVVYTWVNGSDQDFIAEARLYKPTYDTARFDDKNELKYSLRSLEMYAPWVRHVYILTNGQIPHWLDLSYERVTVVPHAVLATQPELLPSFSSAAIETFLHRIPKLSERFLYMNDDIFLAAPLYPEDLYTDAEGVRIYQAWMVPDCSVDCPWTYIGDGACDHHCNIAECQYDGGDCAIAETARGSEEQETIQQPEFEEIVENVKHRTAPRKNTTHIANNGPVRKFPLRKKFRNFNTLLSRGAANSSAAFKELVLHKNLTTLDELRRIVDTYNRIRQTKSNKHDKQQSEAELKTPASASITTTPSTARLIAAYKSTKDIYSQSLIHTNMLLNRHYGFKARNVLAHVGFLLERKIIDAMQLKFADEIQTTISHRFREENDLQFAFAYYSFLMSETRTASVTEIFNEFDTDNSLTWSDREIRTFLARMYPLPLDWSAVRFFEEVITNCSRNSELDEHTESVIYSTLVYERYEDSNLPTITRELVAKCPLLAEALEANFALRPKYKYNINSKRSVHSNFMMLTSNVTDVVDALDKMRRNPRKFNCINDNLEPQYSEDNELIRHLLEDFYLSFFPRRSKFELEPQYRNRFSNWHDYQRWRRRKRAALGVGYCASVVLIVFLLRFLCVHKAKFVRRYVQKL